MNYRKAINTKQKIEETIKNIKKVAVEKSEKVKEFAGSTTEEFKTNVTSTAHDLKENITNSIKDKLVVEFRKNYPSYAISYIETFLVDAFSSDIDSVTISIDGDTSITLDSLLNEIADGMVTEEILNVYKTPIMLQNLFDFLVVYFENEPQLDVNKLDNSITISLVKEDIPNSNEEDRII